MASPEVEIVKTGTMFAVYIGDSQAPILFLWGKPSGRFMILAPANDYDTGPWLRVVDNTCL